MKIIFMGTPEIASFALERLIESKHKICAVVTQPDKPVGRGKQLRSSYVKELALLKNIPVFTPSKLRAEKFHEILKPFSPDIIVVFAYGKILPPEIINLPPFGCVNIHLSLLPKYRGAAPIQWAILNGERTTGATIMKIDEGLDTGDVITSAEEDILDDDDSFSLSSTLSVIGTDLLLQVLDNAEKTGKIEATKQDNSAATNAPMIKKADGLINWSSKSYMIRNKIRALIQWPNAYTFLRGAAFKILKSEIYMDDDEMALKDVDKVVPGMIVKLEKNHGPVVKTGDGYIIIIEAKPENKNAMSGSDLINGGYVNEGDIFK